MSKQEKSPDLEASTFGSATLMGQESLQSIMRSYTAWIETAVELQTETAKFVTERVRKDMELPARIAACGNPQDIYQEQVEFASTMITDYSDESQKITDILGKAVQNSGSPLTIIRP